jgi:hypothetical protein
MGTLLVAIFQSAKRIFFAFKAGVVIRQSERRDVFPAILVQVLDLEATRPLPRRPLVQRALHGLSPISCRPPQEMLAPHAGPLHSSSS